MKRNIFLTGLLAIFMTATSFSQSFYQWKRDRRVTASVGIGGTSYYGDLNDPQDIIDFTRNLTVGLEYKLHPRYDVRADLSYMRISGNDLERNNNEFQRNLSFRSDLIELNVLGIVNAFEDAGAYFERPGVNIHALAGIGLVFFNPKAEFQPNEYVALQPLNTEGADYSRFAFVIPFGLGVNFSITKELSVGLEGLYRLTFTDYLDDVSTVYRDPAEFDGNQVAITLADRRTGNVSPSAFRRGNPDNNDGYFSVAVRLEYYLPEYIFKGSSRNKKFKPRRKSKNSHSPRFRRAKTSFPTP